MHDTDFEAAAPAGPSRSQLRRDALDVLHIAHALAQMSPAQLARVALDEALRTEVERTRAITSHGARKRQEQFLAKQLRKLDADALGAIRVVLADDRTKAMRDAAALHQVEQWRERLLDGGDEVLGAFIATHPDVDRQQLRQLIRNACAERKAGKPPHAFRELFRFLRENPSQP